MKNVVLSTKNIDDFVSDIANEVIRKIELWKGGVQSIKEQPEDLLTRDEACKFLKVNSSTLWAWTNKGRVKAYGISSRRYYKRTELIDALTPLKK